MELRVLGPLEAAVGDRPVALPGGRARILLAVLAVQRGRSVSVEQLTDAAWGPEPPATARAQVQAMVSALRRALGAGGPGPRAAIETREAGYRLSAEAVDTDLGRFERLVLDGRAAAGGRRPAEAVRRLRAALALWRGPAFDGLASEPLRAEAARLAEGRVEVLEECLDLELALGPRPDLVAEIRAVVRAHPLRESAYRLLMLALYRAGRAAEALAAFQDARCVLSAELGVEPGAALQELHRLILTEDPALPPAAAAVRPPGPVPAPVRSAAPAPAAVRAPLFGRDAEVAELAALLATRRLVTLVGPPGVGKTSLALATAQRAGGEGGGSGCAGDGGDAGGCGGGAGCEIGGGARPVELDAVDDPELVPAAVAAALGLPAGPGRPILDALSAGLAAHDALLVLDNCEHVLEACAALADALLSRCRGLRILATSREPLAIPGESVRTVGPLEVPTRDSPEDVLRSAAGRMLVDRAVAQVPSFAVTARTAPSAARICRATEGLPLALELAAAQLRTLPAAEVAARLDRQLQVLARRRARPARHNSLRSAIGWSHRLLTEEERYVFARLSVFAGGFTEQAALAVACGGDSGGTGSSGGAGVGAVLRDLVERSLVVAEHDGEAVRYRLLGAVREFAAEQLAAEHRAAERSAVEPSAEQWPAPDGGARAQALRRHAAHYCGLCTRVGQGAVDGSDVGLRTELRRELPNLRAGLEWALGSGARAPGDPALGADLVGAMAWLWADLPREGLYWVRRALERMDPPAPPEARRHVLYAAGMISFSVDLNHSAGMLAEAARLAEGCGDVPLQLESLAQLSVVRCLQGRAQEAAAIAAGVLAPVLRHGTRQAAAQLRTAVAITHCALGDTEAAGAELARAEEVLAACGARTPLAAVRWAQAETAYYGGDPERAAALSGAALRDSAVAGDLFAAVCHRAQHARNLHAAGDPRTAARWLAASLRGCLDAGLWMPVVDALTAAAHQEAGAGRPERAVVVLAGAQALRERTGRHPAPVELPLLRALQERLREQVGEADHAHALSSGAAMGVEEVVRYALAAL
ncbi:BTAD domain-containing putative transcriptional regulator [Kitasatospora sp. NPDC058170]|uniref:BTAD domain-containing putative transcriptional regulator n=1 Tax=Kitasatospora sp. NPDC058170 TaxID=3346364 RepID=UPI0036D770B8